MIALPLCVEAGLLFSIKSAQDAVDRAHDAQQKITAKRVLILTTLKAGMDAVINAANYRGNRNHDPSWKRQRCVNSIEKLTELTDQLRAEDDAAQTAEMQRILGEIIEELKLSLDSPGGEEFSLGKIDEYVTLNKILRKSLRATQERQVELEAQQAQAAELVLRRRAELERLMGLGLLATAIVAGALAQFFHRDTISEINTLMQNIVRLAKEQPLLPKLRGDSELAQVDAAFHSLVQQREELEQLKKEFLSMVTHDLRSPIAASQASLELLKLNPSLGTLTEDGTALIDRMLANNAKLLTLINDLLDAEKLDTGMIAVEKELVSFNDLAEECFSLVKILADVKGVRLNADDCDELIYCDSARMVQVLVNLVANAIKFSPADSHVRVSYTESSEGAQIAVSDQGPGVPAEFVPKLFERYSQAGPSASKGNGVGLFVTRRLVELHGGSVSVETEVGHGTTFFIVLPPAPNKKAAAETAAFLAPNY